MSGIVLAPRKCLWTKQYPSPHGAMFEPGRQSVDNKHNKNWIIGCVRK